MKTRVIKNYPSPRLMETIGATNQSTAEAIGELVANSFDARNSSEKLKIIIDLSKEDQIIVTDNGKGMTDDILEKAVCIAEDMSLHIERGDGIKGHFGMGFKTSCSTLGRFYEIYTRPLEKNVEYHVEFDITEYSRRPSGTDAWDVVIEEHPLSDSLPLGEMTHGTSFVIKKLRDNNITKSAVLDYLGKAFKGHIQSGDSIIVIDETGERPAKPAEYNFIKGSKIEIDYVFGPHNEYHVTGWAALDTIIHNDGLYGFNIYRHNQLVLQWDKTWLKKAHTMVSRVIGEFNLDFIGATFYKQGIQQNKDWKIINSYMKDYLAPFVTASRNISQKKNIQKPEEVKKIINTLRDKFDIPEYNVISDDNNGYDFSGLNYNNDDTSNVINNNNFQSKSSLKENIKNIVTEDTLKLKDGREIKITYIQKELYAKSSKIGPFDYIFDEFEEESKINSLQVINYKDHPLWNSDCDDNLIKILSVSDSIYRVLVEKLGFDVYEARLLRNEWIWNKTSKGDY